jgi:hypothetical protein
MVGCIVGLSVGRLVGWMTGWFLVTDASGQPICPIFKDLAVPRSRVKRAYIAWHLKTICPDMPVIKFQSTFSNIPEQRRSHLHQRGNPQSRITWFACTDCGKLWKTWVGVLPDTQTGQLRIHITGLSQRAHIFKPREQTNSFEVSKLKYTRILWQFATRYSTCFVWYLQSAQKSNIISPLQKLAGSHILSISLGYAIL